MSGFRLHFNNVKKYANKRLKGLTFISISKTSVKFANFVFNFYYISTQKYDEGCLKKGEYYSHLSAEKKNLQRRFRLLY